MSQNGFHKCNSDSSLYVKRNVGKISIIIVYVDDMILTGDDTKSISNIKSQLEKDFEMTDLSSLNYYLGIEIEQNKESMTLLQGKYIKDLLVKFQMENCNKCATPMEVNRNLVLDEGEPTVHNTPYRHLIGSLIYLTATRLDISHSVGLVSRYVQEPKMRHWKAAKRILRYLKGTKSTLR